MNTDPGAELAAGQPDVARDDLKKQLFPNLFSNGIVLGLNILISLWFTPYLIRRLGVEVYGLLPLALVVSAYLNVITLSLHNASGRFFHDSEKPDFHFYLCGSYPETASIYLFQRIAGIGPFKWCFRRPGIRDQSTDCRKNIFSAGSAGSGDRPGLFFASIFYYFEKRRENVFMGASAFQVAA
jgi:hypothetical protein